MLLLYNLFIRIYFIGIRLAAIGNQKAAKWIEGRRNVFKELEKNISSSDEVIWIHCSSAGEFEQGKPVIEALKKEYSSYKVLVSFFSPSGYGVATNYQHADFITYLPLDTKENAERFLKIVHPTLVIFVKYEFWYHHLAAAAFHHIPVLLVSATFRENQVFFKGYSGFFRQMLFLFRHIFVQDNASLQLLSKNGITHCSINGDTRFDRVNEISRTFSDVPFIKEFVQQQKVIVAGSTWEEDEVLLQKLSEAHPDLKFIIAPHEVNQSHINFLEKLFPTAVKYSTMKQNSSQKWNVLIIDSVGLLSLLYQYATITYVGGGFTRDGIHNILEAAVWRKPVFFGPNYQKYREAKDLIDAGGAFSVSNAEELKKLADQLFSNEQYLQAVSEKAKAYVTINTGATAKILAFIQEKRLLTNW